VRVTLWGLAGIAAVLMMVDIPVQYLINSAAFPGVSASSMLFIAIGAALGIGIMVHGVAFAVLHDPARPAHSIRVCRRWAWVSFMVAMLGVGVLLFARMAPVSMVPHLVNITAVSLWLVAEALPLAAGFFLAWAHILAHPLIQARQLEAVHEHMAAHHWAQQRLEAMIAEEEEHIHMHPHVTLVHHASHEVLEEPHSQEIAGVAHGAHS
jgi:hypothetical protein